MRLFVAVDLEEAVLERIAALQAELRAGAGVADVRWAASEGFHVTLRFLGEVPDRRLPAIIEAMEEAASQEGPFTARARRVGAFPALRRPRVLWVGIESAELRRLAEALEQALSKRGFPREERPFTAHLTLARLRSLRGWEDLEGRLKGVLEEDFGSSRVEELVLYRSQLRPSGAVYTALERVSLGGAGRASAALESRRREG